MRFSIIIIITALVAINTSAVGAASAQARLEAVECATSYQVEAYYWGGGSDADLCKFRGRRVEALPLAMALFSVLESSFSKEAGSEIRSCLERALSNSERDDLDLFSGRDRRHYEEVRRLVTGDQLSWGIDFCTTKGKRIASIRALIRLLGRQAALVPPPAPTPGTSASTVLVPLCRDCIVP